MMYSINLDIIMLLSLPINVNPPSLNMVEDVGVKNSRLIGTDLSNSSMRVADSTGCCLFW